MNPNIALVIFIVIVLLNLAGLILDGFLYLSGSETITEYVKTHWYVGVSIITLQIVGAIALCFHFWNR